MKNLKFQIKGNELVIRVNLAEEHGLSQSGQSVIVASSGGNLRLFDESGFRDERINLTVSKKAPNDRH